MGFSSRKPSYSRKATTEVNEADRQLFLQTCKSESERVGLENFWNMDETFWRLVHVKNLISLGFIGHPEGPKITGRNGDKEGFTTVVTVSASGKKLEPYIVKKAKTQRTVADLNVDATLFCTTNGWINKPAMLDYLRRVFIPAIDSKPSVLLLDSFSAHWEPEVKQLAEENSITLIAVPVGLTSKFQPLDVGINSIIKAKGRKRWKFHMLDHYDERLSFRDGVDSVIACIGEVTEHHIKKAFKDAIQIE